MTDAQTEAWAIAQQIEDLAHRWARAAYFKAFHAPFEDFEPIKAKMRDIVIAALTAKNAELAELRKWQNDQVALNTKTANLIRELHADKKGLEAQLAEARKALETAPDRRHFEILAEAMTEVKASSDGQSDQLIEDIVAGCIEEISALEPAAPEDCPTCTGTGSVDDQKTEGPPSFGFLPCPECRPATPEGEPTFGWTTGADGKPMPKRSPWDGGDTLLSHPAAAEGQREIRLYVAASRIVPYLRWTISDESPGYHPTMPSAVAAFMESFGWGTEDKWRDYQRRSVLTTIAKEEREQ